MQKVLAEVDERINAKVVPAAGPVNKLLCVCLRGSNKQWRTVRAERRHLKDMPWAA